jgi:hypothetical protein
MKKGKEGRKIKWEISINYFYENKIEDVQKWNKYYHQ